MARSKALISTALIGVLCFLQLTTLLALLTVACEISAPKEAGIFLSAACGFLVPRKEPDSWLTRGEAEALVRYNVATNFYPSYVQRVGGWTGYYHSLYQGNGKWKVTTPMGEWILLERQGVAFPVTTNLTMTTMLAPWMIERRLSSIESDISSMRYDISSMRYDISSMESDISSINSRGIRIR